MNLSLSGWSFIWATHACMLSCFSHAQLFETCQALCSPPGSSVQDFSIQESWSGLPCPSPGDLPYPGIEPWSLMSPALAGIFITTSTTKAMRFLKTLCSRFYVKQTTKSKLRPKIKKRESERVRRRRMSGRRERIFTSSNYLLHPWWFRW